MQQMDGYDDTVETDAAYARPKPHWSTQVHKSADYRAQQVQFRDQCRRHRNQDGSYGLPCAICLGPIDYRLSFPHPMSFSLDHIQSVAAHPELALVPSNFQPAHLRHNQQRRQGYEDEDDLDLGTPSEAW